MDWQPIAEAPFADFTATYPLECLVFAPRIGVTLGRVWRYADGEAAANANGYHGEWGITHYMQLPEPPK